MAEEEREAQSAKLQELIRRGGPADLQEANKLMKVMAGYDTRNKTDWRAKAAEEVGKIQQKARILEEMLQGYKPGDQIKEGDVFEVCPQRWRYMVAVVWLTRGRSWPMPFRMRNLKSRRCARRTPRITRLWRNSSRSMTVYTGRYRDTSFSKREISKQQTTSLRERLVAVVLEYLKVPTTH